MKTAVLVLALLFASLSARAQTPILGTERLKWGQAASDLTTAQGYSYRSIIDGAASSAVAGVTCAGSASPFQCSAPVPMVTAGVHEIRLVARLSAGGLTLDSAPSAPFSVQMLQAPTAPVNLGIQQAYDVLAASCSRADVQAAVTAASEGNVVQIPAGICEWTTALVIGKAITLQGQGIGSTVIRDGVTTSPLSLIRWTLVANKTSRMTGIEFQAGSATGQGDGGVTVTGNNTDSQRMRIDHCKFDHVRGFSIWVVGALGVADHNTFLNGAVQLPFYIFHPTWDGGSYGDKSWNTGPQWGTDQFFFIEDSTFTRDTGNYVAMLDAQQGARFVVRHNTITRSWVEAHGTESGGRGRGTRAFEVYANTFTGDGGGGSLLVNQRSGSSLIYDNTLTGMTQVATIHVINERQLSPYTPWGQADGSNVWDKNVAGGPFESRTASSAGTLTVTVAGASFPNYAGYSIKKIASGGCHIPIASSTATNPVVFTTSIAHGLSSSELIYLDNYIGSTPAISGRYVVTVTDATHFTIPVNVSVTGTGGTVSKASVVNCASQIASNTSTVLTFITGIQHPDLTFTAGDTFQIWRVDEALDQPGKGAGALLTGDPPSIPGGWYNQVDDPMYEWNNTSDGSDVAVSSGTASVRINEHYFSNTPLGGYTAYTYPHPLTN